MQIVKTEELLCILDENPGKGCEVSIRHGILNSTKDIFINKELIFLFDLGDKCVFNPKYGYSRDEFVKEYEKQWWIVEQFID